MSRLELAQPTCEDPDVLPTGLGTIRLYGESALAWPQTWLRTKIELKNDIISRVSHFISFPTLPPRRRLPHSVLEPDLLLDLGGRLFRFFSPVEHAAHIADVGGAQPLFRRHELFLLFLADMMGIRSEE